MKHKKALLIFPLVAVLASCGYDLQEVVKGDLYNSPILENNDYLEKNPRLNENTIVDKETVVLEKGQFYTHFSDLQKSGIDPYVYPDGGLDYFSDSKNDERYIAHFDTDTPDQLSQRGYGPSYKLNLTDDIFSYGVLSKLYDGNMFCNLKYENSRVQINENGFNVLYPKNVVVDSEKDSPNYLAIQMKADLRRLSNRDFHIVMHDSHINFHFSFFIKDMALNKFHEKEFIFPIEDLKTNPGGAYEEYTLLVLPLKKLNIDIKGACGYGVSYELVEEKYFAEGNAGETFTKEEQNDFGHRLMLYEILLPGSRWR